MVDQKSSTISSLMEASSEKSSWPFGFRLRAKVTLGIVIPLIMILGAFTAIEYSRHRSVVLANLSLLAANAGQVIEQNLRQQMLRSDFEELQQLLDSIGKSEGFQVVYLVNPSGKVIFAPNENGVGMQLTNKAKDCQPCHALPPKDRPRSIIVTNSSGERVFRSMTPIENSPECSKCHDPQQRFVGLLLTDISTAPLEAPLQSHLRESLLWWVVTILVVIVVVNIVMSRMVFRRLEGLAFAIKGFGFGELPEPVVDKNPDEIGQLGAAFRTMALQVESRNEENKALYTRLQRQTEQRGELLKRLITAQEDERKRVARELHDELGQSLTGLSLQVEAARRMVATNNHGADTALGEMRSLINCTTNQMYNLILALRPSILDDLGLVVATRAYAERLFEGMDIHFEIEQDGWKNRLSPETETALYRIFQEALNNVVRHASASKVRVILSCQDQVLKATISDDGQGFNLEDVKIDGNGTRGLGLLGMQERLALIGGNFEIHTQPGHGTIIRVCIPYQERQNE